MKMTFKSMNLLDILGILGLLVIGQNFALSAFAKSENEDNKSTPASVITLWSRKSGPFYDTPNPDKVAPKNFNLHSAKLVREKIMDAQYGHHERYLGLSLAKIVGTYKPQKHDDGIILHFANGMAVLLDNYEEALQNLRAFVAYEVCSGKKGTCLHAFPDIPKEDAYTPFSDPRPITFGTNKFVVPNLSHPDVPKAREPIFSPWRHVDSLVGIEFVNTAAYLKQFKFGDEPGEQIFRERCQFCHGVRLVGARMGWDFVKPLPLFEKRNPENLLNHVKYPKARAKELGLMMPPQTDITLDEMNSVWKWMKAAATKPMAEYRP